MILTNRAETVFCDCQRKSNVSEKVHIQVKVILRQLVKYNMLFRLCLALI